MRALATTVALTLLACCGGGRRGSVEAGADAPLTVAELCATRCETACSLPMLTPTTESVVCQHINVPSWPTSEDCAGLCVPTCPSADMGPPQTPTCEVDAVSGSFVRCDVGLMACAPR